VGSTFSVDYRERERERERKGLRTYETELPSLSWSTPFTPCPEVLKSKGALPPLAFN